MRAYRPRRMRQAIKPDGTIRIMANRPSLLTLGRLQAWVDTLPDEIVQDYGRLTFTVSAVILKHLFGVEWVEANVIQDEDNKQPPTFLRLEFSDSVARETKSFRLVDLAETLFNLQIVPGFYDKIADMKTADLEASMAEFDFARFLYWHKVAFGFVKPSKVKGSDYDFKIRYPNGVIACADAKCRLEGTTINPETIRNSLDDARKRNLPADKPGMIFIKVPKTWLATADLQNQITAVVNAFLRGTGRIVAVTVYAPIVDILTDRPLIRTRHRFEEYANFKHRFDQDQDWLLFKNFKVPADQQGAPNHWCRLFP